MSLEVRAGWPCSHLVMEEPVSLSEDRRSLATKAPIAGSGSVRILVNDTQYVPSAGLYAQAVLTSSSASPYKVQRCKGVVGPDGNLFTVTTGSGTSTVRLLEGDRTTLAQVQKTLRLSEVSNLVNIGDNGAGSLSLIEKQNSGPASYIRVSGRGAASLGFEQTGARGVCLYPPWDLVAKKDVYPSSVAGVTLVPARYPKFTKPLRGSPQIKVTYTSMPERCPRCGGTYVENDYRFDPSGGILTIQNEDLLYQACLKAILTVQGSNPYHQQYGSKLTTRIGVKAIGASASLIKEDVRNALTQVQSLQTGQRKYQSVQNRELLYSIDNVEVRTSSDDPTVFLVDVVVRNASGTPIQLTTVFSVPGTIALAGTNNQVLGLERSGLSKEQSRRLLLDE